MCNSLSQHLRGVSQVGISSITSPPDQMDEFAELVDRLGDR
jgi:hypothetical protein